MDLPLFKKLRQEELISETEFENIERQENAPVSVYWDVTTLLYLGILLFTGGLEILVYKNIDTIGHAVIIALIAATSTACFVYCYKNSRGYSKEKIESVNVLYDYVLLFGCILMLIFIGYLQFEYEAFGKDWGLATFIPMALLFIAAYYFDHLGVLSMAITNLAAWAGFTVAPMNIIRANDFRNEQLIYTGLILGVGLLALSFVSIKQQMKAHFGFTYQNFGAHILFISLLAALFHFNDIFLLWFLVVGIVVFLFFQNATKEGSFYFLVISVLYGYIGLSYVVCRILSYSNEGMATLYLGLGYFIVSGICLIRLLIHYNKQLKKDAYL